MATLLTTASGLSIFGVGSAFWGLVIGIAFAVVLRWR
jgi:benzoate membrane transport protein